MDKLGHNKTLCKYMRASSALAILESRSIHWTSPLTYNDPFDAQFEMRFPFDAPDVTVATVERLACLVECVGPPPACKHPDFADLISLLRARRHDFTPEELRKRLAGVVRGRTTNGLRAVESSQPLWEQLKRRVRTFCAVEAHDDLPMWGYYGDQHRGAVLRLRSVESLDSALALARQVHYKAAMPVIAQLDEVVDIGLGLRERDGTILERWVLTKAEAWRHEKEWRCFFPWHDDDPSIPLVVPLAPEEFDTLYLGCRMPTADQATLIERFRGLVPHGHVLRAHPEPRRFALRFEPVE